MYAISLGGNVIKSVIACLSVLMVSVLLAATSHAGSWNGWIYQDPYPTANNLNAVKFVTPKKGWVAGEQGTILYTEDGGDTWAAQESGTEKQIKSLFIINELQGWAVGGARIPGGEGTEKGVILHTEDGGKTWIEEKGDFDSTLNSVFFLNDKEGWSAGREGVLVHTTDGGNKWERQNVDLTGAITSVYFTNAKTGWLLSSDVVYRTTDGGKNWNMVNLDIPQQQERLMPGRGPTPVSPPPDRRTGALYFVNDQKGWAVVGLEFIFMTEDGGKSWKDQLKAGPMSYGLGSIAFIDDKRGCAVGTSVICTEDGGKTWKERLGIRPRSREMIDGFQVSLMSITMANQSSGWAVGVEGQIMKTIDGGKTWKMASKRNECGENAFFINKKTGWLHGRYILNRGGSPYICRTNDGGLTWEKRDAGFDVSGIYFIDSTEGWAVGERKEAIKGSCPSCKWKIWTTIKHTIDGGKTWKISYEELKNEDSGAGVGLLNVFFIDRNTAWAVGNSGLIYHTGDGGKQWVRQKSGYKNAQLWRIQFLDSKTGWIAGTEVNETWTGIILYTDDGGHNWRTQYKTEAVGLDGISFMNKKSGWISGEVEWGGGSQILHTTDGGQTWSETDFRSEGEVGNIAFLDENRGIYTTVTGWFSITTDSGKTWRKIKKPAHKQAWHFSEVFENVKSNK